MHPETLSDQIISAAAALDIRQRELRTAQSYVLQAQKRYDDLLKQYRPTLTGPRDFPKSDYEG